MNKRNFLLKGRKHNAKIKKFDVFVFGKVFAIELNSNSKFCKEKLVLKLNTKLLA